MSKNPPVFFVPNEAYLFVRNNSGQGLFETIRQTEFFKQLQDQAKAVLVEGETIAFPPEGAKKLWLVKIAFKLEDGIEGSARLLGYILDANKAIQNSKGALPLDIAGISPNWIAEASPDPAPNGSGGPGRHHVPATVDDFNKYGDFKLPDKVSKIVQGSENINVYVLDSFPDAQSFGPFAPPTRKPKDVITAINKPPVDSLCLHSYFDDQSNLCDPDWMPSHGLFAANIIRRIAPQANITLVPVLNDKAIGTMISLANGLFDVYQAQKNNSTASFVVNMSLAYPNPYVIAAMLWKWIPDSIWNAIFHGPRPKLSHQQEQQIQKGISPSEAGPQLALTQLDDLALKSLADDIQELVNCSTELTQAAQDFGLANGTFIASAGNDQTLTQLFPGLPDNLPLPDYPAIDCHVIGVGALDKQDHMTGYTNMADLVNNTYPGIWAFGGEYKYDLHSKSWSGQTGGIIGEADSNKYVWWAGTSFAAPIVSGVQARLLSANDSLFDPTPNCEAYTVKSNGVCEVFTDGNGQNLGWQLLVTQGPSAQPATDEVVPSNAETT